MAALKLEQATRKIKLKVPTTRTESQRKEHMRTKIVMDGKIIEQVRDFNYLGCNISYCERKEVNNKVNKFQRMYGTICK